MSSELPSYLTDTNAVIKENCEDIKWRYSLTNYDKADLLFEKYKITNHQPGSIEHFVQNLVKNWEKG